MKRRLLDARGAAALLNVSLSWLYKRTHAGTIPHLKDGYWVRFDAAELRRWKREQPTLRGRVARANLARYFGAREAAAFLGRSKWWLSRQTSAGSIPCVRVGNEVRFPRGALREWAAERGLPPQRPGGWSRARRAAQQRAMRAAFRTGDMR